MLYTEENITDLLPQREPMVMVSNLLQCEEQLYITSFRIRNDNVFVSEGYMREPGLIENIAQTAAAGAGYNSLKNKREVPVGYIGAVKNLVIHSLPSVDSEIITKVFIEYEVMNATLIKGVIFLDEQLIAECDMKIFLSPVVNKENG
jgi:predicted hotdog family 3-hydroxylacyl-ACP dehydratase